jgi:hypothetical protein
MAAIQVKISPALLSLPQRLIRTIERAHEQSARETVNEIRQQIIGVGATASFSLLRSVDKQFEDRGAVKAWLAGSDLPYAPFVEYGRKPGKQPPVDAIVRWIAQKPVDIGDRDIRSVAFMIARKIGKRGVKGRFPFKKATDVMRPRIAEIFNKAIEQELSAQ